MKKAISLIIIMLFFCDSNAIQSQNNIKLEGLGIKWNKYLSNLLFDIELWYKHSTLKGTPLYFTNKISKQDTSTSVVIKKNTYTFLKGFKLTSISNYIFKQKIDAFDLKYENPMWNNYNPKTGIEVEKGFDGVVRRYRRHDVNSKEAKKYREYLKQKNAKFLY